MPVDVQALLQRLDDLRSDRGTFDAQWEEAAQRLIPAHVSTFFGRGEPHNQGRKNTEVMYDATAALALQRFSAVIESLATPQGQTWHRLMPADPALRKNRQVRLFLDEVNRLLFRYRYLTRANFVGQSQKTYLSYGAYGNGLLLIDEPEDNAGLRYKNLHLGNTYLMENHEGRVDGVFRVSRMRAREIVQKYGPDGSVPREIMEASGLPSKTSETHEVLHVIQPREDFDPERKDAQGLPFMSVHILTKTNTVLRESGYATFPAALARYTQFENEVYGRGPAQIVLPSIKVLNEQKKTLLKQGHRVVDPILLTHDDGAMDSFSMKPGALNIGGVNADGRPLVHSLPIGRVDIGQELMNDERAVINDAFLISLFQILVQDNARMTATEVLERAREKGMLIAPTTGRLQAEFLGPMIEREVEVLERQKLLPAVPPALAEAGGAFEIEYDAPMSRIARAENAAGFMRSLDTALQLVQATQDPSPLDWFNFDRAMPAIQDINGSPIEWTNTPDQVQALREARRQQQEQQQALEQAPALASAASTVAGLAEAG